MSLRKVPCLTLASLAARRANALKSTGPRTDCGKARVALNPLKHGRRAAGLRDRLARAGYREDEALYCRIRARLYKALAPPGLAPDPDLDRQTDRLANSIWVFRQGLQSRQCERAKLECALESASRIARLCQPTKIVTFYYPYGNNTEFLPARRPTRFCIRDSYLRIGIVFYAQQRRYFTERRCEAGVLGLEGFEPPSDALEDGLRCRMYRLARPRVWERMRFCLDRYGRYHPEWEEEFRRVRARWRGTSLGVWLEPHPILASLRQKEQAAQPRADA